jgi:hypothetical protein
VKLFLHFWNLKNEDIAGSWKVWKIKSPNWGFRVATANTVELVPATSRDYIITADLCQTVVEIQFVLWSNCFTVAALCFGKKLKKRHVLRTFCNIASETKFLGENVSGDDMWIFQHDTKIKPQFSRWKSPQRLRSKKELRPVSYFQLLLRICNWFFLAQTLRRDGHLYVTYRNWSQANHCTRTRFLHNTGYRY